MRDVSDHHYYEAMGELNRILHQARNDAVPWGEEDTIRLLVMPVLSMLSFPEAAIRRTVASVTSQDGSRRRVDIMVGNPFGRSCIVEAKGITARLAGPDRSPGHLNALDQGLTYLDDYASDYCMVTNGREWYLLARAATDPASDAIRHMDYLGIRFQLDEALGERDHRGRFRDVLRVLSYFQLIGHPWPEGVSDDYRSAPVARLRGTSQLLIRDCGSSPRLAVI